MRASHCASSVEGDITDTADTNTTRHAIDGQAARPEATASPKGLGSVRIPDELVTRSAIRDPKPSGHGAATATQCARFAWRRLI